MFIYQVPLNMFKRRLVLTNFLNLFKLQPSFSNNKKHFSLLSNYKPVSNNITLMYTTECDTSKFFIESSYNILQKVLSVRDSDTSNSVIDVISAIHDFCFYYKSLNRELKYEFLMELATNFAINHDEVCNIARALSEEKFNHSKFIENEDKLKTALTPQYHWLFVHTGRQENGVKFLVDMRTDILDLLQSRSVSSTIHLQRLNNTLKDLLLHWFSVGFLKLERITWKSSCDMLQKISDYEAVHPVRNWTDLKNRVGSDRRCFVYTHSSMPDEPLVVLHTALREEIVNSLAGLTTTNLNTLQNPEIKLNNIKAAIFYSISSTQKGLKGIELGNYIIKRVVTELIKEFPQLNQFSTLSPIPKFRSWLFEELKFTESSSKLAKQIFVNKELETLQDILGTRDVFKELQKQLSSNYWLQTSELVAILKPILLRMCLHYLYFEKKRGYALDSVANFHLRNGAEMWRINWMADLTARGLTSSCGIMVNYRYFLDESDRNAQIYIENKQIVTSALVAEMLERNQF